MRGTVLYRASSSLIRKEVIMLNEPLVEKKHSVIPNAAFLSRLVLKNGCMYFMQDSFGQKKETYGTSNQQVLKSLKEFVVDLFGEEAIGILLPSSAALCLRCIRKIQRVRQDLEQKEKDVRNDIKKLGEDNQLMVSTAENIQITPTRKRAASQGLSSSSPKRRKLSFEVCTPVRQTLNVMLH